MKTSTKFLLACLMAGLIWPYSLRAQAEKATATSSVETPNGIHSKQAPGISNFYQLTDRIYSGSMPDGDASFAALQALGIKTIISVDGINPDAKTAERYGIRYVHLPVGYDGIDTNQAFRIVKAAGTMPGPIFVHCHHGMHRGPTGAAVICMAEAGWTSEQAESWLHFIGTSPDYPGLYRTVEKFRPPTPDALKNVSEKFSNRSDKSPLSDAMVQIDAQFDRIKLIKSANFHPPPTRNDLVPAPEALLLDELFKELIRSDLVAKRTPDFLMKLNAAESASQSLYHFLSTERLDAQEADAAFKQIGGACSACHKAYRN